MRSTAPTWDLSTPRPSSGACWRIACWVSAAPFTSAARSWPWLSSRWRGTRCWCKGGTPVASLNWMFFTGLGLLSAGNGFFKPNISTIVGTLYQQGDGRRDAAFTIFYMGINIGAFLASFSAGIAQKYGWHLGFLLAGTGMIMGQLIFLLGRGTIEGKGLPPEGASLRNVGRARHPQRRRAVAGNCRLHPAGRLPDLPSPVGAEPGA